MKKLLFLLLCTVTMYGQTYQNPTFGTVKTMTAPTSTTPPTMATIESVGTIGKIVPDNIPISYSPIHYSVPTATIAGHISGIDDKIGTIVQTTAGVFNRINFTADVENVGGVDYYKSNATSKGTAPSATQSVINDDNQKKYFTQDLIGNAFVEGTTFPAGVYAGQLSVSVSPNSAQQRYTVEIYKTDGSGTPIASGVSGAPVGSLGVTVVTIMDSGIVNLADGATTGLPISGNLTGQLTINTGERIRYHVSAEKVGTASSNITMNVFYGSSYNSYYDVPVTFNMQSVYNASVVPQITTSTTLGALTIKRGSASDTDNILVGQNGAGTVTSSITGAGVLTLSDKLVLGEPTGNQDLIDLPGLNKFTYKDVGGLDYDFNINPDNPNSFFWKNNEGVVWQSMYFGDGDPITNIWGVSSSMDSGVTWETSIVANAEGKIGVNNSIPRYNLDVVGNNRTRGVVNSDTEISISPTEWNVTYASPDLSFTLEQGYTSDGVYNYQFGTSRLAKYSYDYSTLVANNISPFTGISDSNHIGGGTYLNGFLYVPLKKDGVPGFEKIGKYDATTLALVATYDISAQGHEADGIATDGSILYIVSFGDGSKIWKYSTTGTYLGSIALSTTITEIQGISYYKGLFYISNVDNLFTCNIDGSNVTFIRTAPSDVAQVHRSQGLEVINGEIRWTVSNLGGTAYNTYYLNPEIGAGKKFKADVDGNVTATNIKFPSIQVVSTDVNTLDYYKEGTFTPTLEGLTSAGAGTYTTQLGNYTRVGNLVTAIIEIGWTAHTGTGDMIIKGLPYMVRKSNARAVVGGNNVTLSANNYINAFGGVDTTFISLRQTPTGTLASATIPMDTSGNFNITITYLTDN